MNLIPVEGAATDDGEMELTVTRADDAGDLLKPIRQRAADAVVVRDDKQAALSSNALDLAPGVVDTHSLRRGGVAAGVDNDLHSAPWVLEGWSRQYSHL